MIVVDDDGENVIVGRAGRERARGGRVDRPSGCRHLPARDSRSRGRRGCAAGDRFFCLNAAPARPIRVDADLSSSTATSSRTLGPRQARRTHARRRGRDPARGRGGDRPRRAAEVDAVDGTAAGDAFTACLVVSLARGSDPAGGARPRLRRRRARRSRSARSPRCRPQRRSTQILGRERPTPIILDCDPGHDDAIALLLALASPELELLGVTTVTGNQTLDKTTANALRVLEFAGRADIPVAAGAETPAHARAVRRRARPRRKRARRARSCRRPRSARREHAVDFIVEQSISSPAPGDAGPTGPLTNIALLLARRPTRGENSSGSC